MTSLSAETGRVRDLGVEVYRARLGAIRGTWLLALGAGALAGYVLAREYQDAYTPGSLDIGGY